jgi:hypothetical protein
VGASPPGELSGWTEIREQHGDSWGIPPTLNRHEENLHDRCAICLIPAWSGGMIHAVGPTRSWAVLRARGWRWTHRELDDGVQWVAFRPKNTETYYVGRAPLGEDPLAITEAAVGALQLMEVAA